MDRSLMKKKPESRLNIKRHVNDINRQKKTETRETKAQL